MHNITLNTVKDCDSVFSDGENVLLGGKNLWLFRRDGTFVVKYKTIRNPHKVAFLPGNTALIDAHGDGAYHYISIDSGEILWSTLKKGRRSGRAGRFAVSPDGRTVYDVCANPSGGFHIDRFVPSEQEYDHYVLRDGLRVTRDIYCNRNGDLCILQSHILVDSEDPYSDNQIAMEQFGILVVSMEQGELNYNWLRRWQSRPGTYTSAVGCNGKYILRSDFSVLDLDTMETFRLLSESDQQTLPKDGFGWHYEARKKFLTVYYLMEKLNIVIDCRQRKVVARYPREDWSTGYQGSLVDEEFWMGTSGGVIKRPFPL